MQTAFDIRRSHKSSLKCPEQFMVTKGDIVYLRILGKENDYEVMTATADEDYGSIRSYKDVKKLIEVARETHAKIGQKASAGISPFADVRCDDCKREYVKICSVQFISDAYRVAEEFFEILSKHDACHLSI